jgi:hypothetical protein
MGVSLGTIKDIVDWAAAVIEKEVAAEKERYARVTASYRAPVAQPEPAPALTWAAACDQHRRELERKSHNANGSFWFEALAAEAIHKLGMRAAAEWLNAPTFTCDYAPVHFPGAPDPGELRAFRYELDFAVQEQDRARGLIAA